MLLHHHVLISAEVLSAWFCCDLSRCGGVCCADGDCGAPLDPCEVEPLNRTWESVQSRLSPEARSLIQAHGCFHSNLKGKPVTPVLSDGRCAYVLHPKHPKDLVMLSCALEASQLKPLSCALFPIRQRSNPFYTLLNLESRQSCQPAFDKGRRERIHLLQFTKPALIRAFGSEWHASLLQRLSLNTPP